MSATRDQSQKFTFVYSNLYHLYQKGKIAAKNASIPEPAAVAVPKTLASLKGQTVASLKEAPKSETLDRAVILKSVDLRDKKVVVEEFKPPQLMGKRVKLHRPLQSHPHRAQAVEGLRENLKTLQNLHERLKFMLNELEEFTRGPKKS